MSYFEDAFEITPFLEDQQLVNRTQRDGNGVQLGVVKVESFVHAPHCLNNFFL